MRLVRALSIAATASCRAVGMPQFGLTRRPAAFLLRRRRCVGPRVISQCHTTCARQSCCAHSPYSERIYRATSSDRAVIQNHDKGRTFSPASKLDTLSDQQKEEVESQS